MHHPDILLWCQCGTTFHKEDDVNREEYQADVEPYPDEEDMEDVRLDNERERHWRIIFEDKDGGVDHQKGILHAKSWYV